MPKPRKSVTQIAGFRAKTLARLHVLGFTHRESCAILHICIDEMKNYVAAGEDLCFTWGTLHKVRPKPPQRIWRAGRIVTLNRLPKYVVLAP